MRFVYILQDNKIQIETQQDRDKLSPFIRNKKIITNLLQELVSQEDKTIFQYIRLLNQTKPPFEIKNFLSQNILNEIKKTNFIFYKKNTKSSLKKITNFSSLNLLVTKNNTKTIVPKKLKIIIDNFLKEKVAVSCYFEFIELEKDIPISLIKC